MTKEPLDLVDQKTIVQKISGKVVPQAVPVNLSCDPTPSPPIVKPSVNGVTCEGLFVTVKK